MTLWNSPLRSAKLTRAHTLGAWTSLGHPSITEMFAAAHVDFIGIDMEHSTISLEQAQRIIAAAHAGGAACFPRISSHNGEQIKRLLDSGADGIIVPMVNTPEEAAQAVHLPTLLLLFSFMVISAQMRLGGFYGAVTRRIAALPASETSVLLKSGCLLGWPGMA